MALRSSFSTFDKHASYWLIAILLLALALRIYKLDAYGIFLDEKFTMVISQGIVMDGANQKDIFLQPTFTPQEFWKAKTLQDFFEANARGDIGNSPAYYAIVHSWMQLFGISDFSARFRFCHIQYADCLIVILFCQSVFQIQTFSPFEQFYCGH
ncbi:MAG: hypothetical protein R2822_06855 [Spirosomataceae bacterium]